MRRRSREYPASLLLLSLFLLGWPGFAAGQSAGELLTLEQATQTALAANRLTKVAALDEARAADDVAALRTQKRPKFDLKVFEGGIVSPLALSFRQGAFGTFPATGPIPFSDLTVESPRNLSTGMLLTAIQPLTQLRAIASGEKLLELGRSLAAEKTRAQRLTVAANVRRAYYGLQQVNAGTIAAREALTQLVELDRVVGEYVQREAALPGDHLAVRTERARVDHTLVVLSNTEATLKEQLNLLMGRDPALPFTVSPAQPEAVAPGDMAAMVQRARSARPALREAEINVQRATEDIRLTERKRIPDVGVGVTFAKLFNVEVIPKTIAAAGLVVSWEPFDWGRRSLERAAKARTLEQARLGLEETAAAVTVDVQARFRKVVEARSALTVADLARQTATERLRVATDRYRVEAALLKDVLESQTALARTTQEYQQALGAYWTARADLDESIGDQP